MRNLRNPRIFQNSYIWNILRKDVEIFIILFEVS